MNGIGDFWGTDRRRVVHVVISGVCRIGGDASDLSVDCFLTTRIRWRCRSGWRRGEKQADRCCENSDCDYGPAGTRANKSLVTRHARHLSLLGSYSPTGADMRGLVGATNSPVRGRSPSRPSASASNWVAEKLPPSG